MIRTFDMWCTTNADYLLTYLMRTNNMQQLLCEKQSLQISLRTCPWLWKWL